MTISRYILRSVCLLKCLTPSPLLAQAEPSFLGNGCPKEELTSQKDPAEVAFRSFTVDLGGNSLSKKKICIIKWPFEVKPGYRMTGKVIVQGDGRISSEARAYSSLRVRDAGDIGPAATASFSGEQTFTFELERPLWTDEDCSGVSTAKVSLAAWLRSGNEPEGRDAPPSKRAAPASFIRIRTLKFLTLTPEPCAATRAE